MAIKPRDVFLVKTDYVEHQLRRRSSRSIVTFLWLGDWPMKAGLWLSCACGKAEINIHCHGGKPCFTAKGTGNGPKASPVRQAYKIPSAKWTDGWIDPLEVYLNVLSYKQVHRRGSRQDCPFEDAAPIHS